MAKKTLTSLEEIQKIELDTLLEYDRICRTNKLRYYLAGGTLLGAVRHSGFIPWDDDIDVAMPRPDYDRLISIVGKENNSFCLLDSSITENYYLPFMKLINKKTEYSIDKNNYGAFIDVFPVDGLGNNLKKAKSLGKKIIWTRKKMLISWGKVQGGDKLISRMFDRLLETLGPKRLNCIMCKLLKKNDFDESEWVGSIAGGIRDLKEIFRRGIYEEIIELPFEGHMLYALKHYDVYLHAMFGDYMVLPPQDRQHPDHDLHVIIKN